MPERSLFLLFSARVAQLGPVDACNIGVQVDREVHEQGVVRVDVAVLGPVDLELVDRVQPMARRSRCIGVRLDPCCPAGRRSQRQIRPADSSDPLRRHREQQVQAEDLFL